MSSSPLPSPPPPPQPPPPCVDLSAPLLSSLLSDALAFHVPSQSSLDEPKALPSCSSTLYRNCVSQSVPALFSLTEATNPVPPEARTLHGLLSLIGDDNIICNVTPSHGYGDFLLSPSSTDRPITTTFVRPMELRTTFSEAASNIISPPPTDVYYYSSQDDNLRTSHPSLSSLLPPTLPLFSSAINTGPPQAINLWVGDGRAKTSTHSDPFDNVYIVTSGTKTFTILPPYASGLVDNHDAPPGSFHRDLTDPSSPWSVKLDSLPQTVRWSCPPPSLPLTRTVTIQPNQLLYLPAGWFHSVTSSGVSVAYNYWYDREYGANYSLSNAVAEGLKMERLGTLN